MKRTNKLLCDNLDTKDAQLAKRTKGNPLSDRSNLSFDGETSFLPSRQVLKVLNDVDLSTFSDPTPSTVASHLPTTKPTLSVRFDTVPVIAELEPVFVPQSLTAGKLSRPIVIKETPKEDSVGSKDPECAQS